MKRTIIGGKMLALAVCLSACSQALADTPVQTAAITAAALIATVFLWCFAASLRYIRKLSIALRLIVTVRFSMVLITPDSRPF